MPKSSDARRVVVSSRAQPASSSLTLVAALAEARLVGREDHYGSESGLVRGRTTDARSPCASSLHPLCCRLFRWSASAPHPHTAQQPLTTSTGCSSRLEPRK